MEHKFRIAPGRSAAIAKDSKINFGQITGDLNKNREEKTMSVNEKTRREKLANRPLHFFWIVDCSGSMYGEKIATVNYAIKQVLPEMRSAADNNPNAQLKIRALKFSTGASWLTSEPVDIEDYAWDDLEADGVTDLGDAYDLLAAQLTVEQLGDRALPPVLVLLSDGQPTDDYKSSLDKLKKLPWGKKLLRLQFLSDRIPMTMYLQNLLEIVSLSCRLIMRKC